MKKSKYNRKSIIVVLILLGLLISWAFSENIINISKNNYFRLKGSIARDYIQKEFLEIDSLKANALDIDTIRVSVEEKALSAIEKARKELCKSYIKTGSHSIIKHPYYKSFTEYKGYKSDSKIKLFGMNPDHWIAKNKTSFRFKFNGKRFFAKKKINLLSPRTRWFQIDHVVNHAYKHEFKGIGHTYTPVVLCINNKSMGVYLMEDFFDKYLIANNRKKDSFIFESAYNGIFHASSVFSQLKSDDRFFKINTIPKGKKWENLSKRIVDLFHNNNPNQLFNTIDREKLNAVIGLCFLTQTTHPLFDMNLHWYYNPVNNKLEPLIRETLPLKMEEETEMDQIWKKFYAEINQSPALKLIKDWIIFQGEDDAKQRIMQSSLKSALYIKEYTQTNEYKNFVSKLNNEFSYNTSKQEVILQHNISQLISKITTQNENQLIDDSLMIIDDDVIFNKDLVINKNMSLIIKPGVTITLLDNANIYIYGKLSASANYTNPINFVGGENSNSSIYINSLLESKFKYCEFSGLSALNNNLKMPLFKDAWETSSAITIYESRNISFNFCTFENNRLGDDMINAVSSDQIAFNNCRFYNILFDAIDADFSNVVIENCQFLLIGNDAVDVSYGPVKISNSYFERIADKAISAGEESDVYALNCTIKNSELALVVKDGSLLVAENIVLEDNTLELLAFIKKRGYDPPAFKIINCNINKFLIEKEVRNLGIDNYYRTIQSIEDVLYGDQYGKASVK